jgi:hypothetical protein
MVGRLTPHGANKYTSFRTIYFTNYQFCCRFGWYDLQQLEPSRYTCGCEVNRMFSPEILFILVIVFLILWIGLAAVQVQHGLY